MKLKKPEEVKRELAKRHGWLTNKEIAQGMTGISQNTVNRAMRGQPVQAATVRSIAAALDTDPMSIAEFSSN